MQILTQRSYEQLPYRAIVYEWEDTLSRMLGWKLADTFGESSLCVKIVELLAPFLFWFNSPRNQSFAFEMGTGRRQCRNSPMVIPCIIDFYLRSWWWLWVFRYRFSRNKLILVSSREAYEFLLDKGWKGRVGHFPLSLDDRYRITPTTRFEKKFDLICAGRENPVLGMYLKRYLKRHENTTVLRRIITGGHVYYIASDGTCLPERGLCDTREQYVSFLRMSRAMLYSTPGMDDSRSDANGFNQVTPRFLEGIACGCHVLARYPRNADTEYYELPRLTPHIDSYEMFEELLDRARAEPVDMGRYAAYLEAHYTSVRAKQLRQIIGEVWP